MTPEQLEQFLELLTDGASVAYASRAVGFENQNQAYTVARENDWDRSMRNAKKYPNHTTPAMLRQRRITLSEEEILRRYDEGESQTSIAKDAGVSRERIRQIVTEKYDRDGVLQKRCKRKKEIAPYIDLIKTLKQVIHQKRHEEAIEARDKRLLERWKNVRIWWAQDVPLEEIARRLNMKKGSLSWHIGCYRKRYGWFPQREMFGHHRDTKMTEEQKLYAKYSSIIPLWNGGMTAKQISEELNVSKSYVAWGVYHLRKIGVELERRSGGKRPRE